MDISVTNLLIIATVIASFYAWNRPDIFQKWMMNPYLVYRDRDLKRLLTSGFIHQNYAHLFFNMFTLYFFGNLIEQIYNYFYGSSGAYIFLGFYFVSLVVSEIPSLMKHKENPGFNSLGASGGVAAIVFSSILFNPLNDICIIIICVPGFILGAFYLIYSFYQGRRMADHINHDAHLYGALFGIAFSVLIRPSVLMHFFEQIMNYQMF